MTTGFGIDAVKDAAGVVTGTTAEDIRKIFGSLYTPGLISGGLVSRSASALTYTVGQGVAAYPIVWDPNAHNRQTVLGPIPATTLPTTAPASGTRIDYIYAQQLTPATDSNAANIVVRVGTSVPSRGVMLDAYIVSANQTNTNAAVRTGNITYSIPYGATLGPLANVKLGANGGFTTRTTIGTGSFFLPTDRLLHVFVNTSLSASGAVRFSDTTYCEAGFEVFIDGILRWSWTSNGLHQAWSENGWRELYTAAQGNHTWRLDRFRAQGPGTPFQRDGTRLTILDVGPVA